jgi:hypothetical protein
LIFYILKIEESKILGLQVDQLKNPLSHLKNNDWMFAGILEKCFPKVRRAHREDYLVGSDSFAFTTKCHIAKILLDSQLFECEGQMIGKTMPFQ